LATLTQTSTVDEYINTFHDIWLEIPTMTDEEAQDRFVRGLREDIQVHVYTMNPQTTSEAEQLALAYEGATMTRQHPGKQASVPTHLETTHQQPPREVEYMDLDALQARRGRNNWQSRRPPYYRDKRVTQDPPQCFRCGGFGHIERRCESVLPEGWRYWSRRKELEHFEDTDEFDEEQLDDTNQQTSLNVITTTAPPMEVDLIDFSDGFDFGENKPALQRESDTTHLQGTSTDKPELPLYSMNCNGNPVTALIDTGASTSYISPRVCKDLPHHSVQGHEVETAGGHKAQIKSLVSFDLNIADGCTHPWKAYVLDTQFDIILGRDWIKRTRPVPDWQHDTWHINRGNRAYTLTPQRSQRILELSSDDHPTQAQGTLSSDPEIKKVREPPGPNDILKDQQDINLTPQQQRYCFDVGRGRPRFSGGSIVVDKVT
jgi:hypothetical protein